jgi:hypothetical protein
MRMIEVPVRLEGHRVWKHLRVEMDGVLIDRDNSVGRDIIVFVCHRNGIEVRDSNLGDGTHAEDFLHNGSDVRQ